MLFTIYSNVQCDEFDTDLTKCISDRYWELENSCSHTEDVGIRCYPGSWAGIRLGMTARESHMKGVIIEKAGLFDYTTRSFKPGRFLCRGLGLMTKEITERKVFILSDMQFTFSALYCPILLRLVFLSIALQIDFHHHVIQDVEIRNNLQDGVGVVYSDQYAIVNPSARVFHSCTFSGNRRHGITLKQLGVNITSKLCVREGM